MQSDMIANAKCT